MRLPGKVWSCPHRLTSPRSSQGTLKPNPLPNNQGCLHGHVIPPVQLFSEAVIRWAHGIRELGMLVASATLNGPLFSYLITEMYGKGDSETEMKHDVASCSRQTYPAGSTFAFLGSSVCSLGQMPLDGRLDLLGSRVHP